jgi:hypothetical protein
MERPQPGIIRGTILAESLKPGTTLDARGMRVVRMSRYEISSAAPYQPSIWTAIEFEAPEENAAARADDFAAVLLAPGWYVNWSSADEVTVVFPDRIFRYRPGDTQARHTAQEHGRRCGVPEPQLDWTE